MKLFKFEIQKINMVKIYVHISPVFSCQITYIFMTLRLPSYTFEPCITMNADITTDLSFSTYIAIAIYMQLVMLVIRIQKRPFKASSLLYVIFIIHK